MYLLLQPYLQRGDGPIVLVLAPTRELALQIKVECDKFGASSSIKNTVVYGGVPKGPQVRDLRYDDSAFLAFDEHLIISFSHIVATELKLSLLLPAA